MMRPMWTEAKRASLQGHTGPASQTSCCNGPLCPPVDGACCPHCNENTAHKLLELFCVVMYKSDSDYLLYCITLFPLIHTNVSAVQCISLEALLSTASNELFKELSTGSQPAQYQVIAMYNTKL